MTIKMNLEKATYFDEDGVERSLKNSRPKGPGSAKKKTIWPFKEMWVGCEMSVPGSFLISPCKINPSYEQNAPIYPLRWLAIKFGWVLKFNIISNGLYVKRVS